MTATALAARPTPVQADRFVAIRNAIAEQNGVLAWARKSLGMEVEAFRDLYAEMIAADAEQAAARPMPLPAPPKPRTGPQNHRIQKSDILCPSGEKTRLRGNLDAIRLAKKLELERRPATDTERQTLARYVGWGGLSNVFADRRWDRDWEREWHAGARELQSLTTDAEYAAARASTVNAHYTSREIIEAMWAMALRAGFRGGRVLEPACGVGHFIGLIPESIVDQCEVVAVELDTETARIAKSLYPLATVHAKGLEEVNIPAGTIDLCITNVPFAKTGPADARRRYGQELSLHNYFLARCLDALKPGGLLLAVTTHYTLDSSKAQRALLAEKGDLLAAVRLPCTAFLANAKTEVTCDILLLQKPGSVVRGGEPWLGVVDLDVEHAPLGPENKPMRATVNEYFAAHPKHVLGQHSLSGTMYRDCEYTVLPLGALFPLESQLADVLQRLPQNVISQEAAAACDFGRLGEAAGTREGTLLIHDGVLSVVEEGQFVPADDYLPSGTARKRAVDFIRLRNAYQDLIKCMLDETSEESRISSLQKSLREAYDTYIHKHGHLDGPRSTIFDFDPGYYLCCGLELKQEHISKAGEKTVTYRVSDIFTKRTISPLVSPRTAASVSDAIALSLGYRGWVDLPYIASLVATPVDEVEAEIRRDKLAFLDPETGRWEAAAVYLSGHVRRKLEVAKLSADDPQFAGYVQALEAVQPATIPIEHVNVKIGSTWVPPALFAKFAQQTLDVAKVDATYVEEIDTWVLSGRSASAKNTAIFGTPDMTGIEIMQCLLNLKQPQVYRTEYLGDTKTRVYDHAATVAAQAKAEQLQEAFRRWVNGNPKTQAELERLYNERCNFWVMPKFDGSYLKFPGANNTIKLRDYQRNGVARTLQQGYNLLAHAVGAGKTYTMIATAMEQRRLGLARKPMLVVQNATLGQFATAFRTFYPAANVLVATKRDLEAKRRKRFMVRIQTGDWDAVVMPQSSFDLLPNDPQREADWMRNQIDDLDDAIFTVRSKGDRVTVKELEKTRRSLHEKLKGLQLKVHDRQDDVVYFEELGVDSLFLDEAQAYKKPPFTTKLGRIAGLNTSTSQRAFAVLMKLRSIQEKTGGRNVVMATGTPVTNTLGEAWHMINLLAPQRLKEFGVETFDRFVSIFAEVLPVMEQNAGGKWAAKQTLAKFVNGPELLQLIRSTWDVVTPDDLEVYLRNNGQALPVVKGGGPQACAVPLSPAVSEFIDFIRRIYHRWSEMGGMDKRTYSYIPVLTYLAGRAAALDVRLVDPAALDDPGSKVNTMVANAVAIYHDSTAAKGTQLIFCDTFNRVNMSTLQAFAQSQGVDVELDDSEPIDKTVKHFLYDDIRNKLASHGIPAQEIAIVNECSTDTQREALFKRVNAGEVRVMIGGTQRMGVGVNVQERLIALHHLDAPWLPADLEQREGRIVRFGNLNETVRILSYGMQETVDAAIYGKILRKAKFIRQVLSGKTTGREFEDPAGALVVSAQEQMALLSGDPRVFERVELQTRLRNLKLEEEAFGSSQRNARYQLARNTAQITEIRDTTIPRQREMIAATAGIDGVNWRVDLDGLILDRKAAVATIQVKLDRAGTWLAQQTSAGRLKSWIPNSFTPRPSDDHIIVRCKINGIDTLIEGGGGYRSDNWEAEFRTTFSVGTHTLPGNAKTAEGLFLSLRDLPEKLKAGLAAHAERIAAYERDNAELKDMLSTTFGKAQEIVTGELRLREIESSLLNRSQNEQ